MPEILLKWSKKMRFPCNLKYFPKSHVISTTTTILDITSLDVLQFQPDFSPQAKLEELIHLITL